MPRLFTFFQHIGQLVARPRSAQEALREMNGQLLLAEQLAGLGHWRLSLPGRALTWSAEIFRIFGLDPADRAPALAEVLAAYHPEDREGVRQRLEAAITEGRPYRSRSRIMRADGSTRHVESRGVPEHAADGALVAIFGVFMDVTERDAAERVRADFSALSIRAQAADDANRARSAFLATMSHELRTPLNGILGSAELLRLEGGLTESQSARLQTMLRAGAHLLQLIDQVLAFSDIETGRTDLQAAETDPRAVALECLDLVRPMAEAKGLRLQLSVGRDMPERIAADAARLRQILVNLLGNAVKFTAAGGVELRLRRAEGEAGFGFDVADTGPGIDPAWRDRLIRLFDRPEAPALAGGDGAGLGLSIAAKLVRLMGGRILYQDNPGGGSLFRVDLPLAAWRPAGEGAACGCADACTHRPVVPLDVLVVDDVDINRDVACGFLQAAGHRVTCAAGGAEAVQAVLAGAFDAVLMDIRMPGMDGLEATRLIRQMPGARGRVPILAVTAQALAEQIEACRAAGMNGHVGKPFTQEALLQALSALGTCVALQRDEA